MNFQEFIYIFILQYTSVVTLAELQDISFETSRFWKVRQVFDSYKYQNINKMFLRLK